ncbi:hypothetical protein M1506_00665 [Patescibacteria group bacterium]|nr:hypothetical protein [Patescibacteria group bacterium]
MSVAEKEKSWRAATLRWSLGMKIDWPDGRTDEEKIESDERIKEFWEYKVQI